MKIKQIDELFSCTCKFAYLRRFLRLRQNQSIQKQIMIKSTGPVEAPTIVHLDPDEINICWWFVNFKNKIMHFFSEAETSTNPLQPPKGGYLAIIRLRLGEYSGAF